MRCWWDSDEARAGSWRYQADWLKFLSLVWLCKKVDPPLDKPEWQRLFAAKSDFPKLKNLSFPKFQNLFPDSRCFFEFWILENSSCFFWIFVQTWNTYFFGGNFHPKPERCGGGSLQTISVKTRRVFKVFFTELSQTLAMEIYYWKNRSFFKSKKTPTYP